jgi:hypothetical protein
MGLQDDANAQSPVHIEAVQRNDTVLMLRKPQIVDGDVVVVWASS